MAETNAPIKLRQKLDVPWHGLLELETVPMTKEQSDTFIRCVMGDHPEEEADFRAKMHSKLMDNFGYAVLYKRLEVVAGIANKVSTFVTLFLTTLCKSPGDAVMWAYTLDYIYVLENGQNIDMNVLTSYFPMGFPTEDARHKAWDEQKWSVIDPEYDKERRTSMATDNWLDAGHWPVLGKTKIVASEPAEKQEAAA